MIFDCAVATSLKLSTNEAVRNIQSSWWSVLLSSVFPQPSFDHTIIYAFKQFKINEISPISLSAIFFIKK